MLRVYNVKVSCDTFVQLVSWVRTSTGVLNFPLLQSQTSFLCSSSITKWYAMLQQFFSFFFPGSSHRGNCTSHPHSSFLPITDFPLPAPPHRLSKVRLYHNICSKSGSILRAKQLYIVTVDGILAIFHPKVGSLWRVRPSLNPGGKMHLVPWLKLRVGDN